MTLKAIWLAGLLAGATMIGCGASSASSTPPQTTAATGVNTDDDEAMAGVTEHHRYHHGGVARFVAMSLDTLGITPEQHDAVEKIRLDLEHTMQPARAAEQHLIGALADGLAVGSFDAAKIDAAIAEVGAATTAAHDGSAEALNRLHAILTPDERGALIDKVQAHWAVWQKANEDESGTDPKGYLTWDLGLTADQVAKIHAALGESMKTTPFDKAGISAHLHAFTEAFSSDKFDAHTLGTQTGADQALAGWGATHMARFIETASVVLTPEQRADLAQDLREHATHDPNVQGAL